MSIARTVENILSEHKFQSDSQLVQKLEQIISEFNTVNNFELIREIIRAGNFDLLKYYTEHNIYDPITFRSVCLSETISENRMDMFLYLLDSHHECDVAIDNAIDKCIVMKRRGFFLLLLERFPSAIKNHISRMNDAELKKFLKTF